MVAATPKPLVDCIEFAIKQNRAHAHTIKKRIAGERVNQSSHSGDMDGLRAFSDSRRA